MTETKYIHIFINFPRLGLLMETNDSNKVLKKMKRRIWKQLKHMSIDKFAGYCEIRRFDYDPTPLLYEDLGESDLKDIYDSILKQEFINARQGGGDVYIG